MRSMPVVLIIPQINCYMRGGGWYGIYTTEG